MAPPDSSEFVLAEVHGIPLNVENSGIIDECPEPPPDTFAAAPEVFDYWTETFGLDAEQRMPSFHGDVPLFCLLFSRALLMDGFSIVKSDNHRWTIRKTVCRRISKYHMIWTVEHFRLLLQVLK